MVSRVARSPGRVVRCDACDYKHDARKSQPIALIPDFSRCEKRGKEDREGRAWVGDFGRLQPGAPVVKSKALALQVEAHQMAFKLKGG